MLLVLSETKNGVTKDTLFNTQRLSKPIPVTTLITTFDCQEVSRVRRVTINLASTVFNAIIGWNDNVQVLNVFVRNWGCRLINNTMVLNVGGIIWGVDSVTPGYSTIIYADNGKQTFIEVQKTIAELQQMTKSGTFNQGDYQYCVQSIYGYTDGDQRERMVVGGKEIQQYNGITTNWDTIQTV